MICVPDPLLPPSVGSFFISPFCQTKAAHTTPLLDRPSALNPQKSTAPGSGWAVSAPPTACPKVFVKHRHPFDAFGCASSVASRLSRHAARAGIRFPPGQVCGMHSLRGALAVAMIGNGAPMPVISAVLGHVSSDTTQAYYLRFDVERLRCCALDVEDVTGQAGAGERGA